MKRRICRALGCYVGEHDPACDRCGCWLYDYDFVQEGYLEPLIRLMRSAARQPRRLLFWICSPCQGADCRHLVWFSSEHCCSKECWERWMPF